MSCVMHDSEKYQLRRDYHLQILHLGHPSKTFWSQGQGHNTQDRIFAPVKAGKGTSHPSPLYKDSGEKQEKSRRKELAGKVPAAN